MGFKVTDEIVIDSGDTSSASSSKIIDAYSIYTFGVFSLFTGSPDGNLIIEASPDKENWIELDNETVAAAGSFSYEKADFPWRWLRIRFEPGTSTGTLKAWLNSKGV